MKLEVEGSEKVIELKLWNNGFGQVFLNIVNSGERLASILCVGEICKDVCTHCSYGEPLETLGFKMHRHEVVVE